MRSHTFVKCFFAGVRAKKIGTDFGVRFFSKKSVPKPEPKPKTNLGAQGPGALALALALTVLEKILMGVRHSLPTTSLYQNVFVEHEALVVVENETIVVVENEAIVAVENEAIVVDDKNLLLSPTNIRH